MQHRQPLDERDLTPQEKDLEAALGGLTAVAPAFDVHQVRAKAAARREMRRVWFWRGVSGALAACLMLLLWSQRASSQGNTRIVYVRDNAPVLGHLATVSPAMTSRQDTSGEFLSTEAEDNYLHMRQRVLRRGVGALMPPAPVFHSREPASPSIDPAMPRVERAITPRPKGPIYQFLDLLDKESQL